MSALACKLTRSARALDGLHRIGIAARPDGTVKARVRAAHELTRLPYSRTRELWYGRARRVEDEELAAIEAVLPPDTVEFSLAYLRSVENRVASLLEEIVTLRADAEAALLRRDRSGDGPGEPDPAGADGAGAGGADALRP